MVEPTQELMDCLYRDDVLAARRMPLEDKLCGGGELFDAVCRRMREGIRWQFPDADEVRVEEILRQRLEIARRLERTA